MRSRHMPARRAASKATHDAVMLRLASLFC